MHYLLFYEVGDDYVARRAEFRDAHLEKAWQASERGELVLGGATGNPVDGAALLFKGDSPAVAERFARADPYVVNGLVKKWHVREWATVVGEDAATPIGRKDKHPIVRMWKGRASVERADEYVEYATKKVFPILGAIEGHRGAYVLRRALNGAVEFMVLTFWESMEAVRKFAGREPEKAVVEPEARAILSSFDDSVTHFEVAQMMSAKERRSL
jgi:uncharacterized protein